MSTPHQPPKPPAYVPEALRQRRNWVVWRSQWNAKTQKTDKVPISCVTGYGSGYLKPEKHVDYATAVEFACDPRKKLAGIGFALIGDGIIGIDIDDCRDSATGVLHPRAQKIIDLNETFWEVSPSGRGLHSFALGDKSDLGGRTSVVNHTVGIEMYAGNRYFTVTGEHLAGTPTEVGPAPKTIAALKQQVTTTGAKPAAGAATGKNRKAKPANGEDDTPQPPSGSDTATSYPDWVNAHAFEHLGEWVPELFPTAVYQDGTKGYRVKQADLGRPDLQEDLSIHPSGIVDFGVHDLEEDIDPKTGKDREGKRSAIGLVEEWGRTADGEPMGSAAAADWLVTRFGRTPAEVRRMLARRVFTALTDDEDAKVVEDGKDGEDEESDDALLARRALKIDPVAFYGPLARIVAETTKDSEATKVGVAFQMMAHASTCLSPFVAPLGNNRIRLNVFLLLVGPSADGRKGTSCAIADEHFAPAIRARAGAMRARLDCNGRAEEVFAEAAAEAERTAEKLAWTRDAQAFHEVEIESDLDRLAAEQAALTDVINQRRAHLAKKPWGPETVRKYEKLIAAAEAKRADGVAASVRVRAELDEVRSVLKDKPAAMARAGAEHAQAQARLNGLPPAGAAPEPWQVLFARLAEPPHTIAGIGSGEGLVEEIRDPGQKMGARGVVAAAGVEDKRLFVNMDEFGGVLASVMRLGSTLSATLRTLFDCKPTGAKSKTTSVFVEKPYTVLTASITPDELVGRLFDKRDVAATADNGFGNRLLCVWSKRDKLVDNPQATPGLAAMMDEVAANIEKVYAALKPSNPFLATPIVLTPAAQTQWKGEYKRISRLLAAGPNAAKLFKRLPAYARKIAAILAVINGEHEISEGALQAAVAWIEYAAATVNAIAATASERRKAATLSSDGEAVFAALKTLGGAKQPVSSRDVRRKTRLTGRRFAAAVGGLLQQVPATVVLSGKPWVSGQGAQRQRAMLSIIAEAGTEGGETGPKV